MRVILFGATGMVGQGVLRECLLDDAVTEVLSVGRSSVGTTNTKLREVIGPDPSDLSSVDSELGGFDACLFCLGVSSAGMGEDAYRRITYDLTLAVARTLASANPGMCLIYVSGTGTDSTEKGRTMWARVKGATENALFELMPNAYMFRPGIIQPLHGIRSRTRAYRVFYAAARPLFPVLRRLFPRRVITTEQVGRAMINVAARGWSLRILENPDIAAAAAS